MDGGKLVGGKCEADNGGDGDEVCRRNDDVSDVPGTPGLVACSDRAVVEWLRRSQNGFADDGDSPFLGPDSLKCDGSMAGLDGLAAVKKGDRLDERGCEVMSASSPRVTSSRTRWDIWRRARAKCFSCNVVHPRSARDTPFITLQMERV